MCFRACSSRSAGGRASLRSGGGGEAGQDARRVPQYYEFDPGQADGIRHADLDAGERVLNEMIYECQQSLEGIEHAKLDLDARSWARGQGLRE